jgi:hypothetical protein
VKRILLVLLLATLTSGFSCRQQKRADADGNTSAQSNVNVNAQANANTNVVIKDNVPHALSSDPEAGSGKGGYKSVTINVSDDPANPGNCAIADPGPVTISQKKKQKITWCIVNTCAAARTGTVTLDGFTQLGGLKKKHPFGSGSPEENTFNIPYDKYDCKVTTKEAAEGTEGSYKYNISITEGGSEKV